MNADDIWQKIRRDLTDGMELRAWSRQKGYTKVTFRVADKPPGAIVITSPTLSKPRVISQNDFANVAAIWAAYCKGEISRAETTELSQNTSYIFGLLKWSEDQNGK